MNCVLYIYRKKHTSTTMKIIPLQYGVFRVSKEKEFTPKHAPLQPGEERFLTMAICPFLIELPNQLVLLDAGLGIAESDEPVILKLIKEAGYNPSDIDAILLSHLHKDHIAGLGYFKDGGFVQNFPDATIYYQQREMEYGLTQTESHSFDIPVLKALAALPNVVLMNEGNGGLGDYITYEVTGGHSPYHQVFWIREGNDTAFYGADNLPQRAYLKFHIAYKTDYDGKKAMEDRVKWEQDAKENNWQVLLYHDTHSVIQLTQE